MKRIRTIKPEFFTSEDITRLPRDVRLTFIGLWLYVDDFGNENARASLVKAAIWPEDDDITTSTVDDHLLQLAEGGQITLYESGGRTYLSITNWDKHQRVDKPSRTNVPAPPSREPRETVATDEPEDAAMEGKGESGPRAGGEGGTRVPRGGGRDEGTSRGPLDSGPPSPFCDKHPGGTLNRCRACGNARLARREYDDLLEATFAHPDITPEPVRFVDEDERQDT